MIKIPSEEEEAALDHHVLIKCFSVVASFLLPRKYASFDRGKKGEEGRCLSQTRKKERMIETNCSSNQKGNSFVDVVAALLFVE